MLQIHVPETEYYDEKTNTFHAEKESVLKLEHSLVSVSKWEAKWRKPFLTDDPKSTEEILDYIRCMTVSQNVNPTVYDRLSAENIKEINEYINAPMTATWFGKTNNRPSREIITAEIIYYWMIAFNIPVEFEKWHLNRLLTLIRVCSEKNAPEKKMKRGELMARNRALNAARKAKLHTKG